MTYRFFCRFFGPRVSAWLTAIWFAILLVVIFAFSSYTGDPFIYIHF